MKVKFKGQVYIDAWRSDKDGHIWFGGNVFEHIPEQRKPYFKPAVTLIHGFKLEADRSCIHTCKRSSAKLEILSEV